MKECSLQDFRKEDKLELLVRILSNDEMLVYMHEKIFGKKDPKTDNHLFSYKAVGSNVKDSQENRNESTNLDLKLGEEFRNIDKAKAIYKGTEPRRKGMSLTARRDHSTLPHINNSKINSSKLEF